MDFTLTEPFTFDEQRIIHTAFYVYKNSDHSKLSYHLKKDMRIGMPLVVEKLNDNKLTYTFTEFIAIESALIYLHDFFLNPESEDVAEDLKINGKAYFGLIRSVGEKISSDYDFYIPDTL